MSDAVLYTTQDDIAVITLNNPPVNALSYAVRTGLLSGLDKALADDQVQAIVINASGALFSGGADISEFGSPPREPHLPDVLAAFEQSPKLIVAAIDGAALGGGLETALACHYRIARSGVPLGLPEVHLGILPGGGGTQRLPRLAGVDTALKMIVSGTPVSAEKALETGFVDQLVGADEDCLNDAIRYARQLLADGQGPRNASDIEIDKGEIAENLFTDFRRSIARKTRGFFAPERCIQAVEAAVELPFAEGLKRESDLFMDCLRSPQSEAQRYQFFAERQAAVIPDVPKDIPRRVIKKVAVIGAGTMGGGIAMNFANVGIAVTLLELKEEALAHGLDVIRKNYENTARKGHLSEEQVQRRMGLISGTLHYEDLADADLVIEAVFESMEIKKSVFESLDRVCKPGAILATNTSTLNVDEIAAATARPEDVIGLHFFSPANVMRLLEIVRGEKTAKDVIATCMALAKTIKKVGVLVGVCFGFVGNRMLEPYGREAHRLLLEGATPAQVDRVLYDLGMAMGPLTMCDLAGIDVGYRIRESRRQEIAHDPGYAVVSDRLVELGRYGQKTGRGFYIYEAGSRLPKEDPEVQQIILAEAERLGIERREISDQEVLERCLYTLINEGALILDEGIAIRASDIDVIFINGYGFPVYHGGPMHYADRIGLDKVYETLCRYREQLGDYGAMWFQPAPLLEGLAKEGKTFSDL